MLPQHIRRRVVSRTIILSCFLLLQFAAAQIPDSAVPTHNYLHVASSSSTGRIGWLRLETQPPGCFARIDTITARTPAVVQLTPGRHSLIITPPDDRLWTLPPKVDSVSVSQAETTVVAFSFPKLVPLFSSPSGATVRSGSVRLGTTPIILRDSSHAGVGLSSVIVEKEGFLPDSLFLEAVPEVSPLYTIQSRHAIFLSLKPSAGIQPDELLLKPSDIFPKRNSVILLSATTLASGIAAVVLKQKANRYFDLYLSSRDPVLLTQTRRYDTYSGIALAAMEISIAAIVMVLLTQ